MRLKEIKPGMVIHCKSYEEKKVLLEEAERLGYRWYGNEKMPTDETVNSGTTIHFNDKDLYEDYKHISHSYWIEGATEFSDLILSELTAEEVWSAFGDISDEYLFDYFDVEDKYHARREEIICGAEWSELVDLVNQWKSDKEKKELEIETVDICLIINVLPDRKMVVHEETMGVPTNKEMEEILKRFCMEHEGKFIAMHEVVSRVKK